MAGQDRSYRRGLVLGFTLAEVAILIIFALLLALAWHVANKEKELVTLRGALDRSEVVVAQLREQRRQLESRLAAGDDFDHFFREPEQLGRAHVCTPVTNANLVCRLLLE